MLETKGEHLAGNEDTKSKAALLDRLTANFKAGAARPDGLALAVEPFDFTAALVVFDEVQAMLPAMIHSKA